MIFMAVSAVCGGMCNASVRFPRQLHGLCQPIIKSPQRYTTKLVAIQAINTSANFCDLANQQMMAIISSRTPTVSIKCPKEIPVNGSATARTFVGANAVQTLATPVIPRITAAVRINQPPTDERGNVGKLNTSASFVIFIHQPFATPKPFVS